MLINLKIENIAVIEQSTIEFHNGLNVMTGETGAGKSIIIDALSAVLGERTSKELVRTGADFARVSASFSSVADSVTAVLNELDIPSEEDGVLIVSRSISADGRNSCRINGSPATVSMLKALGRELINIHGQHDNQALLNSDNHCSYIDSVAGSGSLLAEYKSSYLKLKSYKSELLHLISDDAEKARETELLEFQINEIESAGLEIGEYDELRAKQSFFRNSERIATGLTEASLCLDGDGDVAGAIQMLKSSVKSLESAARYYTHAERHVEALLSAIYSIEEEALEIKSLGESLEYDPQEAARVEDRLDELHKLMRKYGSTIEDILKYLDECKSKLRSIETADERRLELEALIKKETNTAQLLADKLSKLRQNAAKQFSDKVRSELNYLDMPGVTFYADFGVVPMNENGIDTVEFMISANPGEAPKPLAKTASGGELSRIMLSIKNVLSDKDSVETLIFDEIDTGVSGSAANKLAKKLHEVSHGRQVICVTHLSQIAAYSDSHLLISKSINSGKTFTSVRKLDRNGRINELARITGGSEITELQLEAAEEMLEKAEKDKNFGG